MPTGQSLTKHAKHLVEPPPAFLQEKLSLFGMKPQELADLDSLIICALRKAVEIRPKAAKPKIIDVVSHTRAVTPKTIDQLKELAGAPNRAFAKTREPAPTLHPLAPKAVGALPQRLTISKLPPEQKQTFFQLGHNLLFGPTTPRLLESPGYKQAVPAILRAAAKLPVFVAPNLIVCDGEVVTFAGWTTLYFNNVVVYGSGKIVFGNQTKLHAYHIKRV